jgi:hypothetical protein
MKMNERDLVSTSSEPLINMNKHKHEHEHKHNHQRTGNRPSSIYSESEQSTGIRPPTRHKVPMLSLASALQREKEKESTTARPNSEQCFLAASFCSCCHGRT